MEDQNKTNPNLKNVKKSDDTATSSDDVRTAEKPTAQEQIKPLFNPKYSVIIEANEDFSVLQFNSGNDETPESIAAFVIKQMSDHLERSQNAEAMMGAFAESPIFKQLMSDSVGHAITNGKVKLKHPDGIKMVELSIAQFIASMVAKTMTSAFKDIDKDKSGIISLT